MKHPIREEVIRMLSGEGDKQERSAFSEHIAECDQCLALSLRVQAEMEEREALGRMLNTAREVAESNRDDSRLDIVAKRLTRQLKGRDWSDQPSCDQDALDRFESSRRSVLQSDEWLEDPANTLPPFREAFVALAASFFEHSSLAIDAWSRRAKPSHADPLEKRHRDYFPAMEAAALSIANIGQRLGRLLDQEDPMLQFADKFSALLRFTESMVAR